MFGDVKNITPGNCIQGNIKAILPFVEELFEENCFSGSARPDNTGEVFTGRLFYFVMEKTFTVVFFSILPSQLVKFDEIVYVHSFVLLMLFW